MKAERLVHDANQIAAYFAAYPHDEAVQGVADHLNRFWERRMREAFHQLLRSGQGGFHALVVEAAARVRP
ncbi:MAG TPA: formate dehydrogenase subunit delta [Candidatus Xenobia bacterium]